MTEHYFTKQPTSALKLHTIHARLRNRDFELYSASGVFSKDRVDKGTEVLINNVEIHPHADVLDLGCGIGVVGIIIARCFPSTQVILTDINRRAVAITRKNIRKYTLDNAKAHPSDGFAKIKESFDHILLNPPQTAGKKLCFQLIEESFDHLNKGGSLQLVARHRKGGKTLSEKMESVFGNMETLAKKSGYRVYKSTKD